MGLSLVWWRPNNKQHVATRRTIFATVASSDQLDCTSDLHSPKPLHLIEFLLPSRVAVRQPLVDVDAVLGTLVALALPSSPAREETFRELESPINAPSEHLKMPRAVAMRVAQPATIVAVRQTPSVDAFLRIVQQSPSF